MTVLRAPLATACLLLATLAVSACGSSEPSSSECASNDECQTGETCIDSSCVGGDTTGDDAGEDDAVDTSDAPDVTDTSVEDTEDTREDVVLDVSDTGSGDADTQDAEEDAEPDGQSFPTLANYRACDSDIDCPVGLGNCITDIGLSSVDPVFGERITISDIDPEWPRAGICSLTCANDPSVCDTLQLRDGAGRPVAFECALIAEGTGPYPTPAPELPFADTLDAVAIAAGVPFAAVCRPPFALDEANSDTFCFDCDGTDTCGNGDICWDFASGTEADTGGSCLMGCEDNSACPLGFSCDELSDETDDGPSVLGNFCVPATRTCGLCRDLDGDSRGVGVCGPGDTIVPGVDCDDTDPAVYYSSTDPDHAFPELCGEFDYNCNGLADSAEQVGAIVYPVEHCTACGERCEGVEPNAMLQCQTGEDGAPFCGVVCDDPASFVDCEADVPGCETPINDPNRLFYRDFDGDGAGNIADSVFSCVSGEQPDGYVGNAADCNDDDPAVFGNFGGPPAPPEVCDGIDNDCFGGIDNGVPTVGSACSTGQLGVCATGVLICNGAAGLQCVPNLTPSTEICDGLDNDCDGTPDNGVAGVGAACTGSGLGICSEGTQVCGGGAGLSCQSRTPLGSDEPDAAFSDTNCDGIDGDLSIAIFVAQFGNDANNGSISQPVRTLARAAAIASIDPAPSQILMENGVYESQNTTYVVGNVSVAGGYTRSGDVWTRGAGRATLRASLPPGVRTPGFSYNPQFWPNLNFLTDVNFEVTTAGTSGESAVALDCTNCTNLRITNSNISAGPGAIGVNGVTNTTELGGISGVAGASPTAANGGTPIASTFDRCNNVGGSLGAAGVFGSFYGQGGYGRRGLQGGVTNGFFGHDARNAQNLVPFGTFFIGAAGGTRVPDNNIPVSPRVGADGAARNVPQAAAAGGANTGNYAFVSGWVRAAGQPGARGFPGIGGGGGAGGGLCCTEDGYAGAGGATPGCYGDSSTGGGPGGSSIGMVWVSTTAITFTNVTITAGPGATGGRGGNGGFGGGGAAGGTPFDAPRTQQIAHAGGASSGGQGGNGGGGGAGGSSFAILRPAASTVNGSPNLSAGGAGNGGTGGSGGTGGVHGRPAVVGQSASGASGLQGAFGESLQDRLY